MKRTTKITLLALALGALPEPLAAQEPEHAHHSPHGAVDFDVSCSTAVEPAFSEAVALLHSFEYEQARRAFLAVADRDATCGMAHWGVAMTHFHPLWAPPMPDELAAGRAAAERAARLGAPTGRERAYIGAIGAFYANADRLDHATRARAYRDAMAEITREFPEDDEAAILYALAILGAAPPSDPSYAAQKAAAKILNDLLPEHPQHPGIAHYTIHAFDYPELAELALPAARVYARIAPSSAHALHMPTHIFTRLGLWDESIAANIACARVGAEIAARTHPGTMATEGMHCGDYLVYAYLQKGENAKARSIVDEGLEAERFNDPNFAAGYALLAMPARFLLERREWQEAADWSPPEAELPWAEFRYTRAIPHFVRALGAARSGQPARARAEVDELARLQAELATNRAAGPYDWAGQIEATRLAAAGWLAHAEGRSDEAVRLLTAAAEKEKEVGKHPVTPGPILPARELLGDLLLELGRAREALAAYEAALADGPNRFNALAGAARAARAAGYHEQAAGYYRALVELAGDSAARRVELSEARAYLASR